MGWITLLKAGIKRQRRSIACITALFFLITLSLNTALTVLVNSKSYMSSEMDRLGYGGTTAWAGSEEAAMRLAGENGSAKVQPLIFAGYAINGKHSDNEGQLLAHDPEQYPYRFLNDSLDGYREDSPMEPGDIYISPSMKSTFQAEIGDEVVFSLSRGSEQAVFTIKGYFEDPFMGSSMIDMKSFLIGQKDFETFLDTLGQISDFNILARSGAMVHMSQAKEGGFSRDGLSGPSGRETSLLTGADFTYSKQSILGFMLIQQNIFTGFLGAFAAVLLAVSAIVMGNSISGAIRQESGDLGILKSMGCTGWELRAMEMIRYGLGIAGGMALALGCSGAAGRAMSALTVTSSGLLIPHRLPLGLCLPVLAVLLLASLLFIGLKTSAVTKIPPVQAILGNAPRLSDRAAKAVPMDQKGLVFRLALRMLISRKKQYAGACAVSVLLAFFISAAGRIDTWLGPSGEGLMNAFSAADHDLGVQPAGPVDMDAVERKIREYTGIEESYELAMESVTVDGVEYTANIIDQPSRFHILSGKTCSSPEEIVVTEFVAANLGVEAGDAVTVSKGGQSRIYRISGIYQCANETGGNIGMSREGYGNIGDGNAYIWCRHYILSDSRMNTAVMEEIQRVFRAEAAVHTNSWSGLEGIVGAMDGLILIMYGIVAVFILAAVVLTGSRLLYEEQKDLAALNSLGFTSRKLRLAFAVRFAVTAALGSAAGTALSCVWADPMAAAMLKNFGIGEFRSGFGFGNGLLPGVAVTALFALFAYTSSGRIGNTEKI